MDIIIFLIVCFVWLGVIAFRRFHHYQRKAVIKDPTLLVGYWGTYEGRATPRSYEHPVEYAQLVINIFDRIKNQ
ncbi:MAG: hypothetical protein JST01_14980 [Cyanobacteria bacterium SZAS TMP-1]|nr:hypothetical protein [Cyanobacteria bacterium SZAS TMP-1]